MTDLSYQCHRLFPLPHLRLCLPPGYPLLTSLARHAICSDAGTDCETLARQPRLKNASDHLERPSLDNTTSDGLAAADADVDDALECEGEAVCRMLVVRLRRRVGASLGGWVRGRERP